MCAVNMSASFMLPDYYDENTYAMLYKTITPEDHDYIKTTNETYEQLMLKRWYSIINSLPSNYYKDYLSKNTQTERNNWFQKYLDYPTKDISQMPESL